MQVKFGEIKSQQGLRPVYGTVENGAIKDVWVEGEDGERLYTITGEQPSDFVGLDQFWAWRTLPPWLVEQLREIFVDTGIRTGLTTLWKLRSRAEVPYTSEIKLLREALIQVKHLVSVGLVKDVSGPMSATRATALRTAIRDIAQEALRRTA